MVRLAGCGSDARQNAPVNTPRRRTAARSALTPRAAILAAVVAVVLASLALPVRDLVAQRNRINDLHARAEVANAELKAVNAEIAKWNDPAFVATQARERLHFVLPGQVGYVVLEADAAPVFYKGKVATQRSESWYGAVWGGIRAAGNTAAPNTRPATKESK